MSKFAPISCEDLEALDADKDSKGTKRTVKRSINLFREFLENANSEEMSKQELTKSLQLFVASALRLGQYYFSRDDNTYRHPHCHVIFV